MIVIPEAENLRGKISRQAATLGMAVEDHLREDIVAGIIAPGEALRETALADKLEISTTPIRDALNNLAQQGLVKISTNRSKQAAPLDDRQFLDTVFCRKLLLDAAISTIDFEKHVEIFGQLEFQNGALGVALRDNRPFDALRSMLSFERILIAASENQEIKRISETRSHYLVRHIYLRLQNLIAPKASETMGAMLDYCKTKPAARDISRHPNMWSPFVDAATLALN